MRPGRARGPAAVALASVLLLRSAPAAMAQPAPGLTVEEASRLAQSSSEAIRIRELAMQKSRLAVNEAGAKAWPHVDLEASGSYLVNPPTGYTVKAGSLGGPPLLPFRVPLQDITVGAQLHNYFSVAASLSQPLYAWGKIRNAVDAAALRLESAGTDLVSQRRDIEREVRRAFFSALLAGQSEEVLRRIAGSAALIVADRQTAMAQGALTREAVLEAQSRRAQIDARLVEAEQSKATARESLGVLTGRDASVIELAGDFPDAAPLLDEQALRIRARNASAEIAASRTRQGQALKRLAIERGGSVFRPDVSLDVSLGVTGQEDLPFSGWQWNNDTWNLDLVVTLGVKMSVYDAGESPARIGQAESDAEAAGLDLLQAENNTRMAVRGAVDAAVRAEADLAQRRAQEEYAAEHLKNAQVSLDNGISSREELHGAEILLGTAQLDRLLAQFTLEESLADVARLAGDPP